MRKKKGAIRCLAYQKLRDNRERIETRGSRRERKIEREREEEEGIALFFERDRSRHCLKPVRADSSLHIHSFLQS